MDQLLVWSCMKSEKLQKHSYFQTAGRDYQRVISTVYFHPGETPTLILPINIIDDGLREGEEYFTLQLQSFDLSIVLVNSIAKIVVDDNEKGIASTPYHSCEDLKNF